MPDWYTKTVKFTLLQCINSQTYCLDLMIIFEHGELDDLREQCWD